MSYTITSKDLSYFAIDASLTFLVGRAEYTIKNQEEDDNDVVTGAYTIVSRQRRRTAEPTNNKNKNRKFATLNN